MLHTGPLAIITGRVKSNTLVISFLLGEQTILEWNCGKGVDSNIIKDRNDGESFTTLIPTFVLCKIISQKDCRLGNSLENDSTCNCYYSCNRFLSKSTPIPNIGHVATELPNDFLCVTVWNTRNKWLCLTSPIADTTSQTSLRLRRLYRSLLL